jgi:hypothetical protein
MKFSRARVRQVSAVAEALGAIGLLVLGTIGNQWLLEVKHNSDIAMDYDTMPAEFQQFHFLLQMAVFLSFICGVAGCVFSVQLRWHKDSKRTTAALIGIAGGLPLVLWGSLVGEVSGAVLVPPILLLVGGLMAIAIELRNRVVNPGT